MKIIDALELVIDLAEQNVLDDDMNRWYYDGLVQFDEMVAETKRQNRAITQVREMLNTLKNQSAVDIGPKEMKTEYHEECKRVAQEICFAVDMADEMPLDEQIAAQIHEYTNNHDWLANDARLVQILNYSNYPCYEIFNHGVLQQSAEDDFPFRNLAAGAFRGDLEWHVGDLLEVDSFHESELRPAIALFQKNQ